MTENTKPSFERSPETQWAVDLIVDKLGNWEEATYEDISKAMGLDCRNVGLSHLASAIRIVESEKGWVLARRRAKSVIRVRDEDIQEHVRTHHRARIRNKAKKACRDLGCIENFAALPQEARARIAAEQTVMSVLSVVTSDKRVAALEGRVIANNEAKPLDFSGFIKAVSPKEKE
jgi:hypothetical protein